MSHEELNKEKLVDSLLKSLHYGDKKKQDTAIIEQLRSVFNIQEEAELRTHLIEAVDFSELFAELLRLTEPFARMMNEIYEFLAGQRTTARSLQHLIVGESINDSISFDLEAFPHFYRPIIQQIEDYLRIYDMDKVNDRSISPLPLTEYLLGCGHCTAPHYQKTQKCQECGFEMRLRFEKVFRRFEEMIGLLPDWARDNYEHCIDYFKKGKERFRTGTHWDYPCKGYEYWTQALDEIERRFDLVSEKRLGTYDVTVLLRFFELPFWKERNRLYEVWTLIHFVHLLRGVTFDLNIKDGQWHLIYGDSKQPVAWAHGHEFEIEIWYQHKLKTGLKMVENAPVEPEMLLIYRKHSSPPEPLVLIECKERKNYDVREIYKLSAFYRSQVGTALNIFCNYYDYSPATGVKISSDIPTIIFCDRFRPGGHTVTEVDQEFIKLMNEKLGVFLQTVLVDVSGSMRGLDVEAVYHELDKRLSSLPGSKTICGIFADDVKFYEYDKLVNILSNPPADIGGGTQFSIALSQLRDKLQKNNPETAVINFYIITDVDFRTSDWEWLKRIDADASYNITLIARENWLNNSSQKQVKEFNRIKIWYM